MSLRLYVVHLQWYGVPLNCILCHNCASHTASLGYLGMRLSNASTCTCCAFVDDEMSCVDYLKGDLAFFDAAVKDGLLACVTSLGLSGCPPNGGYRISIRPMLLSYDVLCTLLGAFAACCTHTPYRGCSPTPGP